MQIPNGCFYQDGSQLFLVDTRSVCSSSTHQQGPLLLEPTISNSTVTLVIPHLPSNCQITATVQSQNVSRDITFG